MEYGCILLGKAILARQTRIESFKGVVDGTKWGACEQYTPNQNLMGYVTK